MDQRKTEGGFMIRLDRGEELVATLTTFLAERDIRCGAITGIGAVDAIELGLFTATTREYLHRHFEGEYEIASITGNIGSVEGAPFAHLHGVFTDADCAAIGGHIFSARVSVTCELDLVVYAGEAKRELDDVTGLKLLRFDS
ncbi:MAG: DNA-binding protein [bacterium]|nr:DNA-binding protein [bacterium]